MKKVAIILFTDIKYDGRVLKEIYSLKKFGRDVELILSDFKNDSCEFYDFPIHVLNKNSIQTSFLGRLSISFQYSLCAFEVLKKIKPDIIHCNDLNTLYSGYLYKKYDNNVTLIFDAHELFPEKQERIFKKILWNFFEKRFIPLVDIVIIPELNRLKYFKKKYGRFCFKTFFLPNYPSKKIINIKSNILDNEFPEIKNRTKILYIGNIGKGRKIKEFILALPLLSEEYILILLGYFNGNYKKEIMEITKNNNLSNRVIFHDPVSNSEILNYVASSDIGLVFYHNQNLNGYYCASNKLYEFIELGKPVITNNYPGLIEIVRKNKFGICIDDVESVKISEAIKLISEEPLNFNSPKKYFWETFENFYVDMYK